MDKQSVWDYLSGIPIGTIVAWVAVICAIIAALCAATIKLYKIFAKYKEVKDKDRKQEQIIASHDNTLKEIDSALQEIKESLIQQKEVNLKQLRYTIVHICEDAIEKGKISTNKLRVLEEMYDEYVEIFNGNGYVKTLVKKARGLPVVGKTQE